MSAAGAWLGVREIGGEVPIEREVKGPVQRGCKAQAVVGSEAERQVEIEQDALNRNPLVLRVQFAEVNYLSGIFRNVLPCTLGPVKKSHQSAP